MRLYVPALLILSLLAMPALASCTQPVAAGGPVPRAAVVDQLSILEPNPEFVSDAVALLDSAGFEVEVWQGEDITVDFYRLLPQRGYKLIVFRVHSGILLSMLGQQVVPSETTYMFTGETYSTGRYVSEQLADKVSNAMMSDSYPLVFAVNSQFIADDCQGRFDNTVIISMGCESLYLEDMAGAFIRRGASAYVGLNTIVSLEYAEKSTLELLKNLCTGNMGIGPGIASTMEAVGTDPYYNTRWQYFPGDKGSQTVRALMAGMTVE